jgi:5'-nucleotidase
MKNSTPGTLGHLEGFSLSKPNAVQQKLARFAQGGAAKVHFVFDFDRTLTATTSTGEDITTWQILHGILPEAGQQTSKLIRNKYLAMESAGLLSEQDSHDWSATVLDLYMQHDTNIRDLAAAAKNVHLRGGAPELFAACEAVGIPTVILSAGIGNIIDVIMAEHGIRPAVTLSIKLELAENGDVIGWNRDSMVHTLNKREKGNKELARMRIERPYTVLIGDTIEDARMVQGNNDDILRIRVCDRPRSEHPNYSNYLAESLAAGYDLVVEENLTPIARLISLFART